MSSSFSFVVIVGVAAVHCIVSWVNYVIGDAAVSVAVLRYALMLLLLLRFLVVLLILLFIL